MPSFAMASLYILYIVKERRIRSADVEAQPQARPGPSRLSRTAPRYTAVFRSSRGRRIDGAVCKEVPVVRLMLVAWAWAASGVGMAWAQSGELRLDAMTLRRHIDETAAVCGRVAATSCSDDMTLTLEPLGAHPSFRVRVPLDLRATFGPRPEAQFFRRLVCVKGRIEKAERFIQIVLSDRSALAIEPEPAFVEPPPFGVGAFRECELPGVAMPRVTHEERPAYTGDAQKRRVEGIVWLEAVVETSGQVGDIRVLLPLDSDLDQQAIKALERWRFQPARHEGRAVPFVVMVEMTFTLRR